MPTGQQYGTGVPQATLTVGIGPATTSFGVNSLSGWPAVPFTAVLDIGTSSQEAIDVLAVSGNNITNCTRGLDGTVAQSHSGVSGTLTHADIGRDFREARAHIDAVGPTDTQGHNVHGLSTGVVVGTSESQTLTNKTISAGTYSGNQSMGSGSWSGSGTLTENSLVGTTLSYVGLTGANAQTSRIVGTVTTGAAPVSGTFLLGDVIYDTVYHTFWVCTAAGSPGTWTLVGGVATVDVALSGVTTTFNVPAWASHARITYNARSAQATSGGQWMILQLNGDTGNNYAWYTNFSNNGTPSGQSSGALVNLVRVGLLPRAGDAANYYGTGEIVISDLKSVANYKTVSSHFQGPLSTGTAGYSGTGGGVWQSTSAVTSISLGDNGTGLVSGSTCTVEWIV